MITKPVILALSVTLGVVFFRWHRRNSTGITSVQQRDRIAILIPYIGNDTLPPYFDLFATSAAGSAELVDFIVIHNGVKEPALPPPDNVILVDLKSVENMASLLLRVLENGNGEKDSQSKEEEALPRERIQHYLTMQLTIYPYLLVEFKPALGHIFGQYLKGYSHWGYSDLDIIFGDLPRWITEDELKDYDIVSYGYGDQDRVYLRGQFTFHKNIDKVNQAWRHCKYLSEIDVRYKKVAMKEEHFHFESAEGCYSSAVLRRNDLRVKYCNKAFTDVNKDDTAFTHGVFVTLGENKDRSVVYKSGTGEDAEKILGLPSNWFEQSDTDYSDRSMPLQRDIGERKPVKTRSELGESKVKCMYWAPEQYQADICVVDVESTDTVFLIDGTIYKQKHKTIGLPGNIASAPFFHFQEWKRYYRTTQLMALRTPELVDGWVITRGGVIPLLPDEGKAGTEVETLAEQRTAKWAEVAILQSRPYPSRTYCLKSLQRKANPPAPDCIREISWTDETVSIINRGRLWDQINYKEDVTLALTLQFSNDANLVPMLQLAEANIKSWGMQPCVLVVHVAGTTEETQELIRSKFAPDKSWLFGAHDRGTCLIAGIFEKSSDSVSRKTLLNMATDAALTRWVVSGIEIERGQIISQEASFFARRAAKVHGEATGNVLVFPAFASKDTATTEMKAMSITNLLETKSAGSQKITTDLSSFDCDVCESGAGGNSDAEKLIESLWWELTKAHITQSSSQYFGEKAALNRLAVALNDIQMALIRMMGGGNDDQDLQKLDNPFVLMVDSVGPKNGMISSQLAPEVEALGGSQCYNYLRLVQLAALGYTIQVLPGAFSASDASSRSSVCRTSSKASERRLGDSRCDGCFMYESNQLIASNIFDEERDRCSKAALLWHEIDNVKERRKQRLEEEAEQ